MNCFHWSQLTCLFILALLSPLSISCVSLTAASRISESVATSSKADAHPNALGESFVSDSYLTLRSENLRKAAANLDSSQSVANAPGNANSSVFSESVFSSFQTFVKAGRWHELLNNTGRLWKDCSRQSSELSSECVFVGRARALAFSELGNIESSLEVYDSFVETGTKGNSAFFAEILSARNANDLCSHIARVGLAESSSESREELYALSVRCQRRAGLIEESEKSLRFGFAEYPESQRLRLEAALNQLNENKLTQGCDLLEQLYASKFSHVAVIYNWGQCLVRRADADGAQAVLLRGRLEWPTERIWLVLAGEVGRLRGDRDTARRSGLEYLAGSGGNDELKGIAENLAEM